MNIKQNLVSPDKYSIKAPHAMNPIGICIHNTANDASAKNEISYMVSNNLKVSFHFAVDDKEIWQGVPLDRNAWHAGDGNGEANRKYIGIEICYSKGGGEKFIKAEERAAEFTAQLLKERNWGIDRVKKHQDFSGKYCPHRTLDLGWDRFLAMVDKYLTPDIIVPSVEITDKTKIPLNFATEIETYDEVELGVLKSKIKDKDRDFFNTKGAYKILETNFNISQKNFADLSAEFDRQKGELLASHEENEALREENRKLKEGVMPKPLFKVGRLAVYFT